MTTASPNEEPSTPTSDAMRIQMLTTEHWSLLATRSMTWSEVMSRITIHLTVASASLVVLALVVQSSGFHAEFHVLSIGLATVVLILGTLTGARVLNASLEDRAIVIAMNRLRAAYVALDPSITQYLVTSWHDDVSGVMRTVTLGTRRSQLGQVLAGTNVFVTAVNTIVAGTLGALIAAAAGGKAVLVTAVGVVAGLAYLAVMLNLARRSFQKPPLPSLFPSHAEGTSDRP